jgi:hypothetical protein
MPNRLRQVVIAARDRDATVQKLRDVLGLGAGFEDPGVGAFGLVNAVLPVGDQFLEVITPVTDDAPAHRWIERNGGDGGYMAIFQFDDLDAARARVDNLGVRTVWKSDHNTIKGTHLHPKDMGGAIVSLDWADPPGSWAWAGPDWEKNVRTDVVDGIAAIEVAGADVDRWREVLGSSLSGACSYVDGPPRITAFDLHASDRARVGERHTIGGVEIRLV